MLEMQVESELIRRTTLLSSKSTQRSELASWTALFGSGLRARTAIAVMVMFFQRRFASVRDLIKVLTYQQNGVGSTHCSTTAQHSCRVSA
jgi:hypothetical protein